MKREKGSSVECEINVIIMYTKIVISELDIAGGDEGETISVCEGDGEKSASAVLNFNNVL